MERGRRIAILGTKFYESRTAMHDAFADRERMFGNKDERGSNRQGNDEERYLTRHFQQMTGFAVFMNFGEVS